LNVGWILHAANPVQFSKTHYCIHIQVVHNLSAAGFASVNSQENVISINMKLFVEMRHT